MRQMQPFLTGSVFDVPETGHDSSHIEFIRRCLSQHLKPKIVNFKNPIWSRVFQRKNGRGDY